MHWVVNTDLRRERGYEELILALQHQHVPYTLVRKPPMADFLVSLEDEYDSQGHNKPVSLTLQGPVFVTGTTSMAAVSSQHQWWPGYLAGASVGDSVLHWGTEMLNHDARSGTVAELDPPDGEFFIRPDQDSKSFAGTVMTTEQFEEWRQRIMDIRGWTTLPPTAVVTVASVKEIWAEYRAMVVRGKVITACRYKTGVTVAYSAGAGQRVLEYVERMAAVWSPEIAYVMDVADTPQGLRIIEVNAISAAGFYALDMAAFVREITALGD